MNYKLTLDNWNKLDSKFDAKAGRSLVRSDRICYWKESIIQEYKLDYEEDYTNSRDHGTVSGEAHRITWFLLNI